MCGLWSRVRLSSGPSASIQHRPNTNGLFGPEQQRGYGRGMPVGGVGVEDSYLGKRRSLGVRRGPGAGGKDGEAPRRAEQPEDRMCGRRKRPEPLGSRESTSHHRLGRLYPWLTP